MRRVRRSGTAALAAALVALAVPATAGDRPCAVDRQRHCPQAPVGSELVACLQRSLEKLEPACRQVLGAVADPSGRDVGPCAEEAARHCPDRQSRQAVVLCLRRQRLPLSAACTRFLDRPVVKQGAAGSAGVCAADVRLYCGNERAPARLARCLQEYRAKLQPRCADQVGAQAASILLEAAAQACAADVKRLCSGRQGAAALLDCLDRRADEVASGCRAALSHWRLAAEARERAPGDSPSEGIRSPRRDIR